MGIGAFFDWLVGHRPKTVRAPEPEVAEPDPIEHRIFYDDPWQVGEVDGRWRLRPEAVEAIRRQSVREHRAETQRMHDGWPAQPAPLARERPREPARRRVPLRRRAPTRVPVRDSEPEPQPRRAPTPMHADDDSGPDLLGLVATASLMHDWLADSPRHEPETSDDTHGGGGHFGGGGASFSWGGDDSASHDDSSSYDSSSDAGSDGGCSDD